MSDVRPFYLVLDDVIAAVPSSEVLLKRMLESERRSMAYTPPEICWQVHGPSVVALMLAHASAPPDRAWKRKVASLLRDEPYPGDENMDLVLEAMMPGRSYGLEVVERVAAATDGRVKLKDMTYPTLRELERRGFLRSYEEGDFLERGGRPRRYYELTDDGRRAIATGVGEPE